MLSYILFADDTNVLYSNRNFNNLIDTVNSELPKLAKWFNCNKLSLNLTKTNYIFFRNPGTFLENNCNISINGHQIERKMNTKFLGVTVDQYLNFNQQCDNIIKQISKSIGIMHKLKYTLPLHAMRLLYNSLVSSQLSYCNIVWVKSSKKNVDSLLLLQKKAVRLCSGSHYLAHTNPLFHKLRILKVSDINYLQTAIFMFKLKQNLLPSKFQSMFQRNEEIHSHNTRNSCNFHLFNPKTSLAHRSIRHSGPDIWHSLPEEIKKCSSLYSFKATLKKHILSSYNN